MSRNEVRRFQGRSGIPAGLVEEQDALESLTCGKIKCTLSFS
jgi:hypothetical protein